MKIVLDLENTYGCDDETLKESIRQLIQDGVRNQVYNIINKVIKENKEEIEKEVRKLVAIEKRVIQNIAKEAYEKAKK